MAATYEWLGESGARRLVVKNPATKESIEIPFDQGLAAIDATIASPRNTAKSLTREEFVVAKVVADKNGRIDEIRTWLTGGNRGSIIADLNAKLGEKNAELEALKKKLADAGLAS